VLCLSVEGGTLRVVENTLLTILLSFEIAAEECFVATFSRGRFLAHTILKWIGE
jgi:hypothetical protein